VCGLLFAITSVTIPSIWTDASFFVYILVLVVVPSIYSFVLFRKEKAAANDQQ